MTYSKEDLLWFFKYDARLGILRWRNHWRPSTANRFRGRVAGKLTDKGYVDVKIQGRMYKLHRLIWVIETGQWPSDQIDHINGDASDNRFCNLREVDNRQNCSNQKIHRKGKLPGYTWAKDKGCWKAQIKIRGKQKYLGYFSTAREARDRYLQALREIK